MLSTQVKIMLKSYDNNAAQQGYHKATIRRSSATDRGGDAGATPACTTPAAT